jgi:phage-related protein
VRFANARYRLVYQRLANLIILLHAIERHTGAIPPSDIALAKQRMLDFTLRMDASPRVPPRAAGQDAQPSSR